MQIAYHFVLFYDLVVELYDLHAQLLVFIRLQLQPSVLAFQIAELPRILFLGANLQLRILQL